MIVAINKLFHVKQFMLDHTPQWGGDFLHFLAHFGLASLNLLLILLFAIALLEWAKDIWPNGKGGKRK